MSAHERASRLLDGRHLREAEIVLRALPEDTATLRLCRRARAMAGQLGEAAEIGRRIVASSDAGADDWLRQSQIEIRVGDAGRALHAGGEALARAPKDGRAIAAFVEALLLLPAPRQEAERLLARISSPDDDRSSGPARRLLVQQMLPFHKHYDGGHPGHSGYLAALDLPRETPTEEEWRGAGRLWAILDDVIAHADRMVANFASVDRAFAASFVAARAPTLLHRSDAALEFVTAFPNTLAQRPFVFWYDNPLGLFMPEQTIVGCSVRRGSSASYDVIKAMLEDRRCTAIFAHSSRGKRELAGFFESAAIAAKVEVLNLFSNGGRVRDRREPDGRCELLFVNSVNTWGNSFFFRRGVDVLRAFERLAERRSDVHLTLRTKLPDTLSDNLCDLVRSHPRIRLLDEWMADADYADLLARTDLIVQPAAILYRNSLVDAMAAGVPCLVSDVPAMADFVDDGVNGYVVDAQDDGFRFDVSSGVLESRLGHLLRSVDAPADGAFFAAFERRLDEATSAPAELAAMSPACRERAAANIYSPADQARFNQIMATALDTAMAMGPDR